MRALDIIPRRRWEREGDSPLYLPSRKIVRPPHRRILRPELSFTPVQGTVGSYTGGAMGHLTIGVTLASPPTAGNLICIGVASYNNNSSTPPTLAVVDNAIIPNTYTIPANSPCAFVSGKGFGWVGYLLSAPSGAGSTITATLGSDSGGYLCIFADEFTPSAGAAFDQDAKGTGTTTGNYLTIPVSGAGEMVYAICNGSASAVGSPWTANAGGAIAGAWLAAYVASVSSNQATNWTTGSASSSTGFSIKPAGAASTHPPSRPDTSIPQGYLPQIVNQ